MSNITHMASRRNGTRAGMAPGSVRICVTMTEQTFKALQEAANRAHHSLSGEAAEAIERDLGLTPALEEGRDA